MLSAEFSVLFSVLHMGNVRSNSHRFRNRAQMSPLQILLIEHYKKFLVPSPQVDSFVLNHW